MVLHNTNAFTYLRIHLIGCTLRAIDPHAEIDFGCCHKIVLCEGSFFFGIKALYIFGWRGTSYAGSGQDQSCNSIRIREREIEGNFAPKRDANDVCLLHMQKVE